MKYIYLVLKCQGLEKLNRELKEEDEEQLPVDISLFPDSIFKGFQVSLFPFVMNQLSENFSGNVLCF